MSINEVRYLPECGSTNAYVKEHFEEFGPVAAVYTENQTAGRGRLGRSWVNAEGKALYYTVAIKEPLAQPATLPLLASLAVRRQLQLRYGVDCQIKWPNDLLLNGKKIVGILCESVSYGYQQQGRGILCGIGINLAQPQSYFDAADLPHGTSLALQGAVVDLAADPAWLAEGLTDFGFDRNLYTFARDGFAPFREEYKAACVNLGRRVTFDLPVGQRLVYVTHGHVFNLNHLPPLAPGDILLHGHTHVPAWTDFGQGNLYLNPGSVSIPKENTAHSYMTLEGNTACWKTMEGVCYHQLQL